MAKKQLNISRRKTLAALGAIGAASAGAGLGTSAFYNDQETFENNRLVAGSLDLKMDWEEHYYREDTIGDADLDIQYEEPEDSEAYRMYPAGATQSDTDTQGLWIHEDDVTGFMQATGLEAFPDGNNDAVAEFPGSETACETLADVGGDSAGLETFTIEGEQLGRTDNEDTRLDNGEAAPLINLTDVKPGDFGEVTFSTHLCNNDGYLWLNSPGYSASENTVSEPEGDSEREQSGTVELLDETQTAVWYDNNCNNLPDTAVEPLDLMVVVDTSGTIDESEMQEIKDAADVFADTLPAGNIVKAGLMRFSGYQEGATDDGMEVLAPLGDVSRFKPGGTDRPSDLLPDVGDGNTAMPGALDLARMILNDSTNNAGRDNARKVILLISDGAPDYADDANDGDPTDGFVQYDVEHDGTTYTSNKFAAGGTTNVSIQAEKDETAALASDIHTGPTGYSGNTLHQNDFDGENGVDILAVGISPDPNSDLNTYLQNNIASTPNNFYGTNFGPDLSDTAQQIVQDLVVLAGEEYIFTGTLRELLGELTDDNGIPLDGDRTTSFDELGDDEDADSRECFDASATHCFGFSWWVPASVGNEIQTDSVSFDLGFYTEQCRHNDGSGMNDAEV